MKLGYFPEPYPDEAIFSVLQRWMWTMGLSWAPDISRLLTGHVIKSFEVAHGCNLTQLSSLLLPESALTVEEVIANCSYLPFFAWALDAPRREAVYADLSTLGSQSTAGRAARSFRCWLGVLRFCPYCVAEDRTHFGETYWHRLPQIREIRVCPKHLINFVEARVPREAQVSGCGLIADEVCNSEVMEDTPYSALDLRLASDFRKLATGPGMMAVGRRRLVKFLRASFLDAKGTVGTNLVYRELAEKLCEAFAVEPAVRSKWFSETEELAETLSCTLLGNGPTAPVLFIKLGYLLGYDAETFLLHALEYKEGTRVEPDRWPCLNRNCPAFRTDVIGLAGMRRDYRRRRCAFVCPTCEGTYFRPFPLERRPDGDFEFTQCTRKSGWAIRLPELWAMPGIPVAEIADELGVKPGVVRTKAARLGLPARDGSPRTGDLFKGRSLSANKIPAAKAALLQILATAGSNHTRTTLWREHSGLCRFLIQNDPEWFEANSPDHRWLLETAAPKESGLDWAERDREYAQLTKPILESIINEQWRQPRQVSVKLILSRLPTSVRGNRRFRQLLPETFALAEMLAETREKYFQRKLAWIERNLRRECQPITRRQLIGRLGLKGKPLWPDISHAIQRMLGRERTSLVTPI